MRLVRVAAALLLSVTIPAAASAEIRNYFQSGYWKNYAGYNDSGEYLCGMSTDYRDNTSTVLRSVHIKWLRSRDTVNVFVFKSGWRIPNGTAIAVELGFDKNLWGTITEAHGSMPPGEGGFSMGMISFPIKRESVVSFFEEFAGSNHMWLRFPSGNEKPWVADMNGSREAAKAFTNCVVRASPPPSTQPYGAAPPSQPSLPTQPSQPFAPDHPPVPPPSPQPQAPQHQPPSQPSSRDGTRI